MVTITSRDHRHLIRRIHSPQALQLILSCSLQHCSTDPDLVVTSGLRRSNALINVLNMTDTIQSDYRVTGSLLTASCWPTLLPDFSDIFSSAAMRFVCPECRALGCWERT